MEHVTPRDPTGPRSEGPDVAPPFVFWGNRFSSLAIMN